jgi:hypothetical protein
MKFSCKVGMSAGVKFHYKMSSLGELVLSALINQVDSVIRFLRLSFGSPYYMLPQ